MQTELLVNLFETEYEYATYDWGQYARKVLTENIEKPKFIYLAFNAPHEPVAAPADLRKYMKEQHPNMPTTRIR